MKSTPEMENYFGLIEKNLLNAYDLATRARKKGLDPEETVNIPLAKDMAERVTGLISSVAPQILESNINERIKELERTTQEIKAALKSLPYGRTPEQIRGDYETHQQLKKEKMRLLIELKNTGCLSFIKRRKIIKELIGYLSS